MKSLNDYPKLIIRRLAKAELHDLVGLIPI